MRIGVMLIEASFFCALYWAIASSTAACARVTAVGLSKPSAVPENP
jgi:hypothetical protein